MRRKFMWWALTLAVPVGVAAQTPLSKSIPVQKGETVSMNFDYPELIRVSTWDKSEISIEGSVSINGGENDDAFVLESTKNGTQVHINATIRDIKRLPQRITVVRDGQKMMFHDEQEYRKYQAEHGKGYNSVSWGPDIDIHLEIKVPKNTETKIKSVYGIVEIRDFSGPLSVDATYGGVDAALAEPAVGELTAETNYGQIFTNLNTKFSNQVEDRAFYTFVTAKPGTGPRYNFESKYGNVYLRKAN